MIGNKAKMKISGKVIKVELIETTDYKYFKYRKGNRHVSATKLSTMIEKIKKKNCLMDNPILVDDNFEVIDGQHRLEACKVLKIPVVYKVAIEEYVDNDVALIQTNSAWNIYDYFDHYIAYGNGNYTLVKQFADKNSLSLPLAVRLCCSRRYNTTWIANGELNVDRIHFAKSFINILDKLDFLDFARTREFISAMRKIVVNEQFDLNRFEEQVDAYPERFVQKMNSQEYVKMIEEIYNHKKKHTNHVRFY